MKFPRSKHFAFFFFLLPLAVFAGGSAEQEFLKKFQPAFELNDAEGMKKAVVGNPQGAIDAFLVYADKYAAELDEKVGDQVRAMKVAWSAASQNQFFENVDRYLSRMDSSTRKHRNGLMDDWRRLRAFFETVKGTAQEESWADLEKNLAALSDSLDSIGDVYFGSLARYLLGNCYDSEYRPKSNQGKLALDQYKRVLEDRERLDLKDGFYNQLKSKVLNMEKVFTAPVGGSEGGGGDSGASVPFKEGSSWIVAPLAVAKPQSVADIERFGYDCDDIYVTWRMLFLEKDKPAELPGFSNKVQIMREGEAKFFVDNNGDGKADEKLKIGSGKPEIIEFARHAEGVTDSYALWITAGSRQDRVQRIESDTSPTKERATLYYRAATARTGDLLGEPFVFFDENIDGYFNHEIKEREMDGLEKSLLPVFDSWVIGKIKRAVPASAYTSIAGKWYRVEMEPKSVGKELRLREIDVKEGTLLLDFKGTAAVQPDFLIVKAVGSYQGGFFDLCANKKGIAVPPGGYEILYGLIRSGKGQNTQKSVILRGSSKLFIVEPGKTTTIKLGEPFSFDFQWSLSQEVVTIPGNTISIVGSAGERYELLWDEIPTPDVQLRPAGGKPVGKPVTLRRPLLEDLNKNNSWRILWHPVDASLEVPKGAKKVEAMLTQKHKWFGNIESGWK